MAANAGPEVRAGDIGSVPIIPVILILAGGYLAWFGVHYWRRGIKYPSDPVKDVLQGKGLPPKGPETSSADILTRAQQSASSSGGGKTGGGGDGGGNVPVPPGAHGNAEKNQNIAKLLTSRYGWSPGQDKGQWNALVDLWNRESGWNEFAKNSSSDAYGIPQSLPASKMATAGPDWLTNPATQIKWGLGYIKAAYGSPEAAWAHEEANGWY